MCTLSWLPLPGDGYTVCFNRDERTGRLPAQPPARHHRDGRQWLAPTDGDFGGTWIGANERGLTLCLANRYPRPRPPAPKPSERISRGLLVDSLLDADSEQELRRRLGAESLARYEPFTLGCVLPGRPPLLLGWDGAGELTEYAPVKPGLVHTSPAEQAEEIGRLRRESFARAQAQGTFTPAVLARVHASHWPERGPRSVCFHHPLASTVSRTQVWVDGETVTLVYTPGPPCVTAPLPSVSLPRAG